MGGGQANSLTQTCSFASLQVLSLISRQMCSFKKKKKKNCHFRPELSTTNAAEEEEEVGGLAAASRDNETWKSAGAAADPVLTQPGLGSTATTITTITQTGGDWSSGLLDVCGDTTTCM